jgi:CrcB protein
MLNQLFLIAIGGAVGSVLRYLVSTGVYSLIGRLFPFGTLTVNIIGSLAMGFLSVFLLERFNGLAPHLRALLLVGFLGGFTTFSAFSLETLALFENGDFILGLLNILLSVSLCLVAVWFGTILGRLI